MYSIHDRIIITTSVSWKTTLFSFLMTLIFINKEINNLLTGWKQVQASSRVTPSQKQVLQITLNHHS